MRYSPSVSLMSTAGIQSATVMASFPLSGLATGRPNIRLSRSDMSSTSRNGPQRTRLMITPPCLDYLSLVVGASVVGGPPLATPYKVFLKLCAEKGGPPYQGGGPLIQA